MTTKDMITTLSLIKDYWPEYSITIEDLQSPTSEFVITFYKNFIVELHDKLLFLNSEDSENEIDDHLQEINDVHLYVKVAKILRKLSYTSFSFSDLYFPQLKRIHASIKYSIHFLIYVNNVLDDISNTFNWLNKKDIECENLRNLRQQCLQDIAENATNIGSCEEVYEELKKKLDVIKTRYEKMQEDKVNRDKNHFEKTTEINKLQSENDNLDYELNDLEVKEKDLQEHIVTEDDFKSLKNIEKYLEVEHEQIIQEDLTIDQDEDNQLEMLKYTEENIKNLENWNIDSLHVDELHKLKQELNPLQNMNNNLKNGLITINNEKIGKLDKNNKRSEVKEEGKKVLLDLQAKISLDVEVYKKQYEQQIVRQATMFEESQRLETKIIDIQEELKNTDDTERDLKKFVVKHYKHILDTSRTSTTKFNNMLLNLKNQKP